MKGSIFLSVFLLMAVLSNHLASRELYVMGGIQDGGDFERSSGQQYELDPAFTLNIVSRFTLFDEQDYEFIYSFQGTELVEKSSGNILFDADVHYLHFGSATALNHYKGWDNYLLGSLGGTYFSPSESASGELLFSAGLGFSTEKQLESRWNFRADFRVFVTYFSSGATLFCVEGDCDIPSEGDLETQFQLTFGLGLPF